MFDADLQLQQVLDAFFSSDCKERPVLRKMLEAVVGKESSPAEIVLVPASSLLTSTSQPQNTLSTSTKRLMRGEFQPTNFSCRGGGGRSRRTRLGEGERTASLPALLSRHYASIAKSTSTLRLVPNSNKRFGSGTTNRCRIQYKHET